MTNIEHGLFFSSICSAPLLIKLVLALLGGVGPIGCAIGGWLSATRPTLGAAIAIVASAVVVADLVTLGYVAAADMKRDCHAAGNPSG